MFKINCAVQNYAWGRLGSDSEVAKLFASGNAGAEVEEDKPYAELWMGTHPSGPSVVASTNSTLKSWIEVNEASLGKVLLIKYGKDLPFLFKVLSVRTALSIQAHPHKSLAEELHADRPHVYKDDNHKPEMTLALTDFEALSCFVSHEELSEAIGKVPELAACIGTEQSAGIAADLLKAETRTDALKSAFKAVMTRDGQVVKGLIEKLVDRLRAKGDAGLAPKEELILRLNSQYPGDVGIFAAYFLNYIKIKPGQAIYLEANEPHAYLSGNCVEVMATSDNVVRAGLTPKLRDTDVLCSMLTYKAGMPEVLNGDKVTDHMKSYTPPFDEFQINVVDLPARGETVVNQIQGPLLVLVYDGKGKINGSDVAKGEVYFVPDGHDMNVQGSESSGCSLYIASANKRIF
ncbi:mannose-6-phosphate isomerase [Chloropicon primus]|uniref:mannose-6-phosphate isomerase n=1 Tax=Chloropicon primus TaxID=1764295 RepID=A0A5B8MHQ2_9CHLO|nr:mannose-6-phosphate isomerase [Chloropicon primus]|eukprot:QDZ18900.1 mannose-6-phosphate isomerase [Chloropicon primus]